LPLFRLIANFKTHRPTQPARSLLFCTAAAAAALAGCGGSDGPNNTAAAEAEANTIQVEIRRTSYGVPHIVGKDVRSAAYGLAYAYAQDNVCTAANQFLSVSGERARYLGAGTSDTNLRSDYYHRLMFDAATIDRAFPGGDVVTRDMIGGYVEGYNRFLADARPSDFGSDCAPGGVPADWARRPLTEMDYKRHLLAVATQSGAGAFQAAILDAQPPAGVFPASVDTRSRSVARAGTWTRARWAATTPHLAALPLRAGAASWSATRTSPGAAPCASIRPMCRSRACTK
jgi:acyl-homoserine-lactone acylase